MADPGARAMHPFDLSNFTLADMLRCGLEARRVAKDLPTMEDAASAIVRYFHAACVDPATTTRACALVRCYKTHRFDELEPEQQAFARRLLRDADAWPAMRCLTLLASAGDLPDWNSRRASRGHLAIPLPSAGIVEEAPMIAQLIKQLGLDVASVLEPSPEVVRELLGKTYNVFHVEEALGSPYIPAQHDFVVRQRIRSVLGFGGMLPTGDLYAIILFARVPVPRGSADRFRTIALDVKSALYFYRPDQIFSSVAGGGEGPLSVP
ncbi:MAG: hypothetical protein WKG32_01600 [Gemmatimonadaceae bacterium]